jgi:hypothetical protein
MEGSALERAVRERSWEWLVDAAARLQVAFELTDERLAPMLPPGPGSSAAALRHVLSSDAALRAAVLHAGRSPIPVSVDGFDAIALQPLDGLVLIVAQAAAEQSPAHDRQALSAIGRWLADAIAQTLEEPPDSPGDEAYRIRALRRMLADTLPRGSVRRLGGAFVEAVGVWNAIGVRIYVSGVNGRLIHYVSPIGASASSTPSELEPDAVPADDRLTRLGRSDRDRLGFTSEPGDVFVRRIRTERDVNWLLVFSGAIDEREQVRLALCADIFRELLVGVLSAQVSHLVGDIAAQELPANGTLPGAVETVVQRIADAVQGTQAALAFENSGRRKLETGNTGLLENAERYHADRVMLTRTSGDSTMTLTIARDGAPFATFERTLVEAGAAALHARLHELVHRWTGPERRARFRSLPEMFDELAADAVRDGQAASFVVLSAARGLPQAALVAFLGRIRGELRPGDYAAILSDREIGVLLCGATSEGAAVVSARLRRVDIADDITGEIVHPSIGVSTCSPDMPVNGSLVAAARLDAAFAR